jgi:DNA-binding NarL/FixJ family response regulator
MIRVVLAEEHRIVRWALAEALAKEADIEVVGEADTVQQALELVQRVKPDIVILDTSMPDHSGFDLLAALRHLEAGPLIIVFAPHTAVSYAARAIAAGAHAYLDKNVEPEAVVEAIRAVQRGDQVIPPGVDALLAAGDGHPASALTARELQVMEMLARGMTNREIAEDLQISVKTVDTHRGHVLKKLGLRNNSELTRFAVKHGYVTL